ncbi:hypothetical protein Mgra_00008733 [Meloidogyne graminicola]|uniref:glucuronosyltransferase n=1 Tax=Meloidogyne graminicola TaxID=189291 RepID=A0A8S9ZEW2_9BILA|nr:hypothetical protein Mgra_00008733 [Meloidogyne graminicola]
MLVYSKELGHEIISQNFQIIYVPININWLNIYRDNNTIDEAYSKYRNSNEFYFVGIYNEILTNQQVNINNKFIGIYNWLFQRINEQKYSFGILEYNLMASPLAIYDIFQIKNIIDVSSSILFPQYLQLFDIDITQFKVPELLTAKPGDWKNNAKIWQMNNKRYKLNIRNHLNKNVEYLNLILNSSNYYQNYIIKPKSFYILFKQIKYHFINQHQFGIFKTFPSHEKIIYIGGICVEEENKLINNKIKINKNEPQCVVLVSFGTVNLSGKLESKDIKIMFNKFKEYPNCLFKVRINLNILPLYDNQNIELFNTNEEIPQQEILSKQNTKLFISHCGQNILFPLQIFLKEYSID